MDSIFNEREQKVIDFALSLDSRLLQASSNVLWLIALLHRLQADKSEYKYTSSEMALIEFCHSYVEAGAMGISGHMEYVIISKLHNILVVGSPE